MHLHVIESFVYLPLIISSLDAFFLLHTYALLDFSTSRGVTRGCLIITPHLSTTVSSDYLPNACILLIEPDSRRKALSPSPSSIEHHG